MAILTLMALFKTEPSELDWLQVYDMTHWWKFVLKQSHQSKTSYKEYDMTHWWKNVLRTGASLLGSRSCHLHVVLNELLCLSPFGMKSKKCPSFLKVCPKLKTAANLLIQQIKVRRNSFITTVNPEIFARVLFSRNFAYAKLCENKILAKWRNHSVLYWYW